MQLRVPSGIQFGETAISGHLRPVCGGFHTHLEDFAFVPLPPPHPPITTRLGGRESSLPSYSGSFREAGHWVQDPFLSLLCFPWYGYEKWEEVGSSTPLFCRQGKEPSLWQEQAAWGEGILRCCLYDL